MSMARLKWHGKDVKAFTEKEVMKHVITCAGDLHGKSARQAPVDTGDLRSNCNISPKQKKGNTRFYEVGYDLPYAIKQHERLDFNHPKGGKAKFLEDPFNENKKQYDDYIQDKFLKALGREK